MSKLVVDKLQKSGGPELTLPTTAGASNSLIVNDGTGALSFSTLGNLLPAGNAETFLKNDGAGNLSFERLVSVPNDTKDIVGFIRSSSAQSNSYSTPGWTTGPVTTFNSYGIGSISTDTVQSFNMLFGDGHPNGTNQEMYTNNREGEYQRDIAFAWGNRLGHYKTKHYYDQNTTVNYTGVTWSMLPIRNSGATNETVSLSFVLSSDFSSFGGAGIALFTPTQSTYSATTGGAWTQLATSQNTTTFETSVSFSVPAGKTVLLMTASSHDYQTTNQFFDYHMIYNLQNCFTPTNNVYCDLRMLETLYKVRAAATLSAITPELVYTKCGAIFGNR